MKTKTMQDITVRGASEHNLKHLNLDISRQKITVVTGVSGSGKSSLVFDTILAEAQRRFFYTLSHYTRQFLDLSTRPKIHALKGLSPAIALAQSETPPSVRATVGTLSDLAELMNVLFARFGKPHCPEHMLPTESISIEDIVGNIESGFEGQLVAICSPIVEDKRGHFRKQLNSLATKGYLRVYIDGSVIPLTPTPSLVKEEKHTVKLIVDYVKVKKGQGARLLRSIQTAFNEGEGFVEIVPSNKDGDLDIEGKSIFSAKHGCQVCGFSWPKLDSRYFSSNSLGRCVECNGLGSHKLLGDEETHSMLCSECRGTGIAKKLEAITINGRSIHDLSLMPIEDWLRDFEDFQQSKEYKNPAFKRVCDEILTTARKINDVGIGYLHLARRVLSLSGGEAGRLKLSGILSEQLRGVLYILDEPSQGLHPDEMNVLVENLKYLKMLGNTIIIVDHDEHLMRAADRVIDLGPGGGAKGGHLIVEFAPSEAEAFADVSLTAKHLSKPNGIVRLSEVGDETFSVKHASINNLSIAQVSFRKHAFNTVCGVSGSGKTSLVIHTLYRSLAQQMGKEYDIPKGAPPIDTGASLENVDSFKTVALVDRKPIAKTSVSMPITYLGAFTAIRQLFAQLPSSQMKGLTARSFSLQVTGGRCEECKGRGEIVMSMKFLPDARVKCDQCEGKRYTDEMLDIQYKGLSIAEVLELTLEEAVEHFKYQKQIVKKLQPALDLGLGYLKLGQPTLSLSGGENQRLKLVPFMMSSQASTHLLVLDEPTRGLHFVDVEALMKVLRRLVERKATVVCIEHNVDVVKQSDWVVELGPGAASLGGNLVFSGTVKTLSTSDKSRMKTYL